MKSAFATFLIFATTILASGQSGNREYDQAMDKLNRAETKQDRFYALGAAAKVSFNAGHAEQAKWLAEELQNMLSDFQTDWNYGNAIHDVNVVLGRLAVSEGRIEAAKAHLMAAGKTPGSPQLSTFGPNMSLARDLLRQGEKDAVLKYFKLCAKFWGKKSSRLPQWTLEVQRGQVPDFGANLNF
jgi:hypothetical protein